MSYLARASSIGMLGFSLAFPIVVSGQEAAVPLQSAPSDAEPVRPSSSANASNGGVSQGAHNVGDPTDKPEAAPTASGTSPPASGGYSWSNKKKSQKVGEKRKALDPKRPLVQAPNFLIRSDGTSVVSLTASKATQVSQKVVGRRVEYTLKSAQVGVHNNLNPLITAHFATPLVRAALRRDKGGVVLVLDLREKAQPVYRIRNGPGGSSILEVTLPKPSRTYEPQAAPVPDKRATPDPVSSGVSERNRKTQKPRGVAGPGPRL